MPAEFLLLILGRNGGGGGGGRVWLKAFALFSHMYVPITMTLFRVQTVYRPIVQYLNYICPKTKCSIVHVHYHSGGSMKLIARILHLAYMVYL
jgi:hypothetical protein